MSIGEVLNGISKTLDPNVELGEELLNKIINLVLNLKNHGKLKGISSELVKMACCHLIKLISTSKVIINDRKIIGKINFNYKYLRLCLMKIIIYMIFR